MSVNSSRMDESVAFLPHITWTLLDGEIIVTDLGRDRLFGLEGIGVAIWNALTQGKTPQQVTEAVCAEYADSEEDQQTIQADVERLLKNFEEEGWITRAPGKS